MWLLAQNCVVLGAEEVGVDELGGSIAGHIQHRLFWERVQGKYLDPGEAAILAQKAKQIRRYGLVMGGIVMECASTYEHILGIRSFQNHNPSRYEYAEEFVQHELQNTRWQVLSHVKTREAATTLVRQTAQMHHQIVVLSK